MATTFSRLKKLTEIANRQNQWSSKFSLATTIQEEKTYEFKTSGTGNEAKDYMKADTLKRLTNLAIDLDLLEQDRISKEVHVSEMGKKAILSNENYKQHIKMSVQNYLKTKKVPIDTILESAEKIKLPKLPDISTIHESLENRNLISEKQLRTAMYLYALADGIERKSKVIYVKK
ncbi:MAG: hypothetical protein ACEPOZ_18205 [Marinifilaceae bacterium]